MKKKFVTALFVVFVGCMTLAGCGSMPVEDLSDYKASLNNGAEHEREHSIDDIGDAGSMHDREPGIDDTSDGYDGAEHGREHSIDADD